MFWRSLSFREIYKDKGRREKYKVQGKTGALWLPECWALILGRGRAVISNFMKLGALHAVTDSCVFVADTSIPADNVKELSSVGSGFERKEELDDDDCESISSGAYNVVTQLQLILFRFISHFEEPRHRYRSVLR